MDDTNLAAKVGELRARGLTPKQIAKTLGVRRADVEPLIRAHAQATSSAVEPAVVGCWVSPRWSHGLTWTGHHEWHDIDFADDPMPGLISVLVAREHRYGKVSACGFLVDAQCLGVKNAVPPMVIDRLELGVLVQRYFGNYDEPPVSAPIELAQHVVLGALEYARRLGFDPHPDFEVCRGHLGTWSGSSAIEFGFHGKPLFVRGPHDDAQKVIRTLEQSVGPGQFELGPRLLRLENL